MNNADKDKLLFINGIRVILCSMVLVSHFYNFLGGRYIHGIRVIGAIGARAVDVFFFLTGFFTLLSYENRKMKPVFYFGHKLKRLYPEYVPALIIVALTYPLFTASQEMILRLFTGSNIGAWGGTYTIAGFPSIRSFLLYLFFSNGIIPVDFDHFFGVAWCLPVEVYFYLIFSILMLISFLIKDIKAQRVLCKGAFIISLIAGVVQRLIAGEDAQQTLIRSLPVMFMGVLMAEIFREERSKKMLEIVMIGVGMVYLFLLDPSQNWISVGIIFFVVLMLLFPDKSEGVRKLLSSKLFVWGGSISFSFYLIHTTSIALVFWCLMKINESVFAMPAAAMIVIALPVSLLFTVGYSVIMVKFAGWSRRIGSKFRF